MDWREVFDCTNVRFIRKELPWNSEAENRVLHYVGCRRIQGKRPRTN